MEPNQFGHPGQVLLVMPAGGDLVSQRIALLVHRMAVTVRLQRIRSSQACARFGFSREVWSEVMTGRRWPGETVLAAMVDVLTGPS